MIIRAMLDYVKKFFRITDVNDSIDSQFEYLLSKALEEGLHSENLIDYGVNLYGELLNEYSDNKRRHR